MRYFTAHRHCVCSIPKMLRLHFTRYWGGTSKFKIPVVDNRITTSIPGESDRQVIYQEYSSEESAIIRDGAGAVKHCNPGIALQEMGKRE